MRVQEPYDYREDLARDTKENDFYRRVVFTVPSQFQLVFMSLRVGEFIANEKHRGTQFIRVESGKGQIIVDGKKKRLKDDTSVIIAPHVSHFVHNTSKTQALKLYTVYAPPEHAENALERNQPVDH